MATARPRKMSFENQQLLTSDYFAIIPSSLNFTMLVEHATTGPQGAPLKQMERIKELLFYAYVVVNTANVVISRCCFVEDRAELFLNACRTCSTLIFLPIKFLICDVVIPFAVVDTKAP